MAKNHVQFQKGISIHQFMKMYGTEEQCQKRLFEMRWPTGYRCPNCLHDKYCQLQSRALFQCNRCHHQASLISGTLFAHAKLPLTMLVAVLPSSGLHECCFLRNPKPITGNKSLSISY